MQFKKLLLASMFVAGSVFVVTSCSSSKGKKASSDIKITGKLEKGDVKEASCTVQGLDKKGVKKGGSPIKADFHAKNSTYTISKLPKAPVVEVICKVKKYVDDITKADITGSFELKTVGEVDSKASKTKASESKAVGQLNMNVLTTLATDDAIEDIHSGKDVITAMKTEIGDKYRRITGRTDFPSDYDPATANLSTPEVRKATVAVLSIAKTKPLKDVFSGKVPLSEIATTYEKYKKDPDVAKFMNDGGSTDKDGNTGTVIDKDGNTENSGTGAVIDNRTPEALIVAIPELGDIKSGKPTETVGGNAKDGYTLELPNTYTTQEEASFKINIRNGNNKYVVVSDGTTAIPSAEAITGDTKVDVTTGDIKGLLTDIVTANKDLFICILDTTTIVGSDCNASTSSVAKLTVSIVRYKISFSKSTIGQDDSLRIIKANGYNAAGVGDIATVKFTLKSDDVHVLDTAQTVKYAMSSYQDTAASFSWNGINRHPIDMTLDTATDISSLFNGFRGTPDTGNLRTFNVCMLASTATKDDCPYDVKVDGVKVLAVASFKAASGTAVVLKPGLGDPLSETERVPAEATWTKMPFGMGYMGVLPQGYKTANFGIRIFNADGKYLVLSDGTTAISAAITGDDATVKIDNIKPLLTDISVASGKTLYMCIADTVTTEGTTCDKDTTDVTLVMMSIQAPGLSSMTKNKPDTVVVGGTFVKGYTIVLPSEYDPAQDETSFKIKVANGDGKFVVVSDGTSAIASTEAIIGDKSKEVTTGDIKSLLTDIVTSPFKKLFVCVLPNSSPAGTDCKDGVEGAVPLVFINSSKPKISFSKSSIGQAASPTVITSNGANVGAVGDSNIKFTLSANDVNVSEGVTYAIMSDSKFASPHEITVGTPLDLLPDNSNHPLHLFFSDNKVTFTVCMLSKIADIRDCSNGVQADGKKVLAVATFKAKKS